MHLRQHAGDPIGKRASTRRGVAEPAPEALREALDRELRSLDDPDRLLDLLICGALVEARSCERFDGLASRLPAPLGTFSALGTEPCTPWTDCLLGSYVSAEGTATSDRQCTPCPRGQTTTALNALACAPNVVTDLGIGGDVSCAVVRGTPS